MKFQFYLRFSTSFGQSLFLCGNTAALGNGDIHKAMPLNYLNNEFWHGSFDINKDELEALDEINYYYILRYDNGEEIVEGNDNRVIKSTEVKKVEECVLIDTWNHMGEVENVFYTQPFQEVLLKSNHSFLSKKNVKSYTHEFRVKAPLLQENEVLCIAGNSTSMGNWQTELPLLLTKNERWWTIKLNFSEENFPIQYKYGVFNIKDKKFVQFETSENRIIPESPAANQLTILHDGFATVYRKIFKGAGVAIPLFSLRSKNSFGTGEITDLKLLVDWAKNIGLKLIQLLPINDTTATHTWKDSYPYAAISAFALHPLYLNLEKVAGAADADIVKSLKKKQKQLNELSTVDYEQVMKFKLNAIKELYQRQKEALANDTAYFTFFDLNRHWLAPYAAFCYLRDKYKTADFNQWKSHKIYNENAIQRLVSPSQKHYDEIAVYYFTQYHLHLQLTEATKYAHKNGIIVKGDIPIGIYRYSVDAWTEPALYNMNAQAGAPPDDFAVKGQNWGFPTYNWKQMQQDNFTWWRKRFEQMSNYFDAFRIDHILGFFRIWSIPLHAVEGILGKFVPAIPVHMNEFLERKIPFDKIRYCKPFINDEVLHSIFGNQVDFVKENFLKGNTLKDEFDTQRKVEQYFNDLPKEENNKKLKTGLYDLISNIILIEDEEGEGMKFHFRIAMEQTLSFKYLDSYVQQQLKDLYINYFYRRQDDFWKKEAMHKLPGLKSSTNMLICGEDLGMVPACVPDVMKQLGILSLEIQRMPKKTGTEFFHPNDAPYLSVITPSTHDMSTIRGWWEEDKTKIQRFYNQIMGQQGEAPYFCEPWINKEIIFQHLYSPAMWSIFQLQDLLGINGDVRNENPHEERINEPANPNHYWKYRMHLTLEELIRQADFNKELKQCILDSGR